jgi:PIN domain nuclease of toxin-antitoxin system
MMYLLDTSAILIHYRKEPGYERILALFDDPTNDVLLSSVSLTEFGRVLRANGLAPAQVDEPWMPISPCSPRSYPWTPPSPGPRFISWRPS